MNKRLEEIEIVIRNNKAKTYLTSSTINREFKNIQNKLIVIVLLIFVSATLPFYYILTDKISLLFPTYIGIIIVYVWCRYKIDESYGRIHGVNKEFRKFTWKEE